MTVPKRRPDPMTVLHDCAGPIPGLRGRGLRRARGEPVALDAASSTIRARESWTALAEQTLDCSVMIRSVSSPDFPSLSRGFFREGFSPHLDLRGSPGAC